MQQRSETGQRLAEDSAPSITQTNFAPKERGNQMSSKLDRTSRKARKATTQPSFSLKGVGDEDFRAEAGALLALTTSEGMPRAAAQFSEEFIKGLLRYAGMDGPEYRGDDPRQVISTAVSHIGTDAVAIAIRAAIFVLAGEQYPALEKEFDKAQRAARRGSK
jgi:hypothetical protein